MVYHTIFVKDVIKNKSKILFENEYNICYILKPLHLVSQIFGFPEISFNHKEKLVISPKKIHIFYSIIIIMTIISFFLYGAIDCFNVYYKNLKTSIIITEFLISFISCLSAICTFVTFIWNRNVYLNLISKIKTIDEKLHISPQTIMKHRKQFFIAITSWIVYVSISFILDFLSWFGNNNSLQILLYYNKFVIDLNILEYIFKNIIVTHRIQIFNSYVKNMCWGILSSEKLNSEYYLDIEVLNIYCYERCNNFSNMLKLMSVYVKLKECIDLINILHGIQVNKFIVIYLNIFLK